VLGQVLGEVGEDRGRDAYGPQPGAGLRRTEDHLTVGSLGEGSSHSHGPVGQVEVAAA